MADTKNNTPADMPAMARLMRATKFASSDEAALIKGADKQDDAKERLAAA